MSPTCVGPPGNVVEAVVDQQWGCGQGWPQVQAVVIHCLQIIRRSGRKKRRRKLGHVTFKYKTKFKRAFLR